MFFLPHIRKHYFIPKDFSQNVVTLEGRFRDHDFTQQLFEHGISGSGVG